MSDSTIYLKQGILARMEKKMSAAAARIAARIAEIMPTNIRSRLSEIMPTNIRSRIAGALCSIMLAALTVSCVSTPQEGFPDPGVDRIRRETLYFDTLPDALDGYRIALVSDVHLGNNFSVERLGRLVAAVNREKPDCVILCGDFILNGAFIEPFAAEAAALYAPDGMYAVLGNHDFFDDRAGTVRALRSVGIMVLEETSAVTPRGLQIAGTNDFQDMYPASAFLADTLRQGFFTVLASHNPDYAEEGRGELYDLMLSGHNHGGQITLFGFAPALRSDYGQKYRSGLVRVGEDQIFVTNGAGYGGVGWLRFRLFAPSEFAVLSLRRSVRK